MNKPSHIILSRMLFSDKELLKNYLKISKEMLIPNLKSQTNKNFKWCVLILKEDIDYVKNYLEIDFLSFNSYNEFLVFVKDNNIDIQTRHDIDDYMSNLYIQKIQEIYLENIQKYDMFLIQAQPVRLDFFSKKEYLMQKYNEKCTSMFLSLCQKNNEHHINERQHGQMPEICNKVITIPEGYVKWVIHGNNITCKRTNIYNK